MIAFPNAKINLGLRVLDKRPDGFHNIESVLYPVGLHDVLEIIPSSDGKFSFSSTGLNIPGDPSENLCVKAFRDLQKQYSIPSVRIHLHKVIPMGAGLGGGSSDGAFTVRLLNNLFSLGLSDEMMRLHTEKLGSDCPFFIRNRPVLAEGRGDKLSAAEIDLSSFTCMIVVPGLHVNTAEAYKWLDSRAGSMPSEEGKKSLIFAVSSPVDSWKDNLVNDFEAAVLPRHPEIRKIKELLYDKGAVYSAMTGSGAALFGLFRNEPDDFTGFIGCSCYTMSLNILI